MLQTLGIYILILHQRRINYSFSIPQCARQSFRKKSRKYLSPMGFPRGMCLKCSSHLWPSTRMVYSLQLRGSATNVGMLDFLTWTIVPRGGYPAFGDLYALLCWSIIGKASTRQHTFAPLSHCNPANAVLQNCTPAGQCGLAAFTLPCCMMPTADSMFVLCHKR